MSIEEMISTKQLIIIPANPLKKLESLHVPPLYPSTLSLQTHTISYHENTHLNKEIIKAYSKKPDVIIIHFSKSSKTLSLHHLPKFPILYQNTLYITPILLEQLNGFSQNYKDSISIIQDFCARIYHLLGTIISEPSFSYLIHNYDPSGLHDLYSGILKKSYVCKIQSWMTRHIPKHSFGWLNPKNQLAIDYIFDNFSIQNVAEFGIYLGSSTQYISSKNQNMNYYCFDRFDNLFDTNYVASQITPLDTEFFFKYMRYETFSSNLSNIPNLYTIKGDNYKGISFLVKNKIPIDLFYIDFIKTDKLLIQFLDELCKAFPDSIVIGDDAVFLKSSLQHFENKYHYINLHNCYILSKNKKLTNTESLLQKYYDLQQKENITSISKLISLDHHFKIRYILQEIKNQKNPNSILSDIKKLNIQCNEPCYYIFNYGNLFHFIGKYRLIHEKYAKDLYHLCNQYQKDENVKNKLNLIPMDYFNYFINFQ
jgi:hypothetical protein